MLYMRHNSVWHNGVPATITRRRFWRMRENQFVTFCATTTYIIWSESFYTLHVRVDNYCDGDPDGDYLFIRMARAYNHYWRTNQTEIELFLNDEQHKPLNFTCIRKKFKSRTNRSDATRIVVGKRSARVLHDTLGGQRDDDERERRIV